MSFSSDVKDELFNFYDKNRHCNIAELAAVINAEGMIFEHDNKMLLKIQTENSYVAHKCFSLIKKIFDMECDVAVKVSSVNRKNHIYFINIDRSDDVRKLLSTVGIMNEGRMDKRINSLVVSSVCCKRAYIRGAFLASGSLCNPEKTYHLEFVCGELQYAEQLREIINSFEIDSKVIERKKHFIVYIKEGEQIVDLLNIMSAHKSLMNLENVRILKGVRNNVNRIVNCETANLNKIVSASVRQRESIEYIQRMVGLDYLSEQLEEMARLRLDYPDLSLKELGEKLVPPVGKSGVNHRLKKINAIAENLREDMLW